MSFASGLSWPFSHLFLLLLPYPLVSCIDTMDHPSCPFLLAFMVLLQPSGLVLCHQVLLTLFFHSLHHTCLFWALESVGQFILFFSFSFLFAFIHSLVSSVCPASPIPLIFYFESGFGFFSLLVSLFLWWDILCNFLFPFA